MEVCVGCEFWKRFFVDAKSSDDEFSNEKLGGEVGQFLHK